MNADNNVSIIMPLYNSAKYLVETIESILAQTYENWSLIIVDDQSTDDSYAIAQAFETQDCRIKVFQNIKNEGAAKTRNNALEKVKNRFVFFIDSDDLWLPTKLENQLRFMLNNEIAMSFTSYETIEENGAHRNCVHVPHSISYSEFLKNTVTCSHTIAFDLYRVPIDLLMCPTNVYPFDYPEDLVVWLQVLKTGITAHGLTEVLAKYRKHSKSRSANKLSAVKRTWNAYTKIERLSVPYAAYCLAFQLCNAAIKRF